MFEAIGNSIYGIFKQRLSYTDAAKVCGEQFQGALASIPNAATNRRLTNAINSLELSSYSSFYFGFSDQQTEGTFLWLNDLSASLSWTNWDQREPSNGLGMEDCATLKLNGKWNDRSCSYFYFASPIYFICEKSKLTHDKNRYCFSKLISLSLFTSLDKQNLHLSCTKFVPLSRS